MTLRRLSGRKVCERVKTKGILWRGKHLQARFLRGLPRHLSKDAPPSILVGLLTSSKLHKSAVMRNRMRRRCREAFRVTVLGISSPLSESVQLLLLPRSSSLSAPFSEILADCSALISFLSPRG